MLGVRHLKLYIGSVGLTSLRKSILSKDLKEVGNQPCGFLVDTQQEGTAGSKSLCQKPGCVIEGRAERAVWPE